MKKLPRPGDKVRACRDFNDTTPGESCWIAKGTIDEIESVSSDHHGGWQLNLVKHGRGWTVDLWEKVDE